MFPCQSYYHCNNAYVKQEPVGSVNVMGGEESIKRSKSKSSEVEPTTSSMPTDRGSSRSHREAERRRRQRINSHLSTLRSLLPNTTKTDKASLLAEVVQHVRELSQQAADVAGYAASFPDVSDEASLVSYCEGRGDDDGSRNMVRVSVCCDDRPGLNRDLTRAIQRVRARAVRAEMATVGGRTRSVVVMEWATGSGGDQDGGVLRRALKAVVENRAELDLMGQKSERVRVWS